ncbi:MAG: type II toxin-antitoxin system Phd/YefM family antitoxin [Chloroflexota bacterium]
MVESIPQRELRNNNAAVIDAVASGRSFVVTRHGKPVAELRPIRTARRTLVPKTEIVAMAEGGPPVDLQRFQADLDRVIDQKLP